MHIYTIFIPKQFLLPMYALKILILAGGKRSGLRPDPHIIQHKNANSRSEAHVAYCVAEILHEQSTHV
jgi:hypothetical protein